MHVLKLCCAHFLIIIISLPQCTTGQRPLQLHATYFDTFRVYVIQANINWTKIGFAWLFLSSLKHPTLRGSIRLRSLLLGLYHISIYDHHPDLSSRKIGGHRVRWYKSEMRRLITEIIWFIYFYFLFWIHNFIIRYYTCINENRTASFII